MNRYLSCILLFCVSINSFALPSDKNAQVAITANYAEFDNKSGQGNYCGKVEVIQGSSKLIAEQATTISDSNNQLIEAIAKGKADQPAHYRTIPAKDQPELHAKADVIKFYPQKNLLLLIGNAELTQGRDAYRAPHIEYNTKTRHVRSKANHQERTVIVIHPNDHKRKNT